MSLHHMLATLYSPKAYLSKGYMLWLLFEISPHPLSVRELGRQQISNLVQLDRKTE